MPPKFKQSDVLRQLRAGATEAQIRAGLAARDCPPQRVSQMLQGARDIMRADCDAAHVQAAYPETTSQRSPASARPMPATRRRLRGKQVAPQPAGEAEPGGPASSSGDAHSGEQLAALRDDADDQDQRAYSCSAIMMNTGMANDHIAALSNVQDETLLKILWLVLDDLSLLALSLVCRRWSEAVRIADVWKQKEIYIVNRPLRQETLRNWYPRWRMGRVAMTYNELDMLEDPRLQTHVLHHPWGAWRRLPSNPRCPWHVLPMAEQTRAWVLTAYRAPLQATVMKDPSARRLGAPIRVGWTTAANHHELSQMVQRVAAGRARPSDVIMAVDLCPVSLFEETFETVWDPDLPELPLCFDDAGQNIADLAFDPLGRTLTVRTDCNGEEELHMVGEPLPRDATLRLFVSAPWSISFPFAPHQVLPDVRVASQYWDRV